MDSFVIRLTDRTYTIELQENGNFRVMEGGKVGVIYPEPSSLGIAWKTMDDRGDDFATQIGRLISAHQMGNANL